MCELVMCITFFRKSAEKKIMQFAPKLKVI